jgi:protein TonB
VVGDGASGRGGASAAAPGASSSRRDLATPPAMAPREARRHRARPATEVASRPPLRAVAARSAAPLAPAGGVDTAAAAGLAAAVDTDSGSPSPTAPHGGGTAEVAVADGAGNGIGNPNSIAHADYATNPPPTYPAIARRREQQGTVTLRVLVRADGSVSRAEIAESSGFDRLDEAALDTVRSRWRFVAARHDGFAVESWVLVPIRFALVEANANR